MLKTCLFAAALACMIAAPACADGAKVDDTAGIERYAPTAPPHAPSTNVGAVTKDSESVDAEVKNLEATRAAIDKKSSSNIQLNVSGWVSQQVEVTH